jgi:hypothetical protein
MPLGAYLASRRQMSQEIFGGSTEDGLMTSQTDPICLLVLS